MKTPIFCSTIIVALMLYACTGKQTLQAELTPAKRHLSATTLAANVSVIYTDESTFVNSLASHGFKTPVQLNLNRQAASAGYTSVYGFNIPADRQVKGFKWNSGDQQTNEWRPQGITGFQWAGQNYVLVTWYAVGPDPVANQHKGVRVSLVNITDMNNIDYRHILLVQDVANRNNPELYRATNPYVQLGAFAPVTIHAGGIACYQGKIFVADTRLGIRVFDLTKFIPAATGDIGDRIGKETNGTLKAFNYAYILPQTGYYKITNASPFSCIELGEGATAADKILWTGQYIGAGSAQVPKVYGFHLNSQGMINTGAGVEEINPLDKYDTPVYGMQGVFRAGPKTFMVTTGNSSYEGSTARLVRYNDGETEATRYRWPHGAEDLYLEPTTGYLWNLTEYETAQYGQDNRCVFAVRLSDYD